MNKKVKVWGRDFQLKVIFDVYGDEEITLNQKDALESFLNVTDTLLSSCNELKQYCLAHNASQIDGSIDNIFKYVIPVSLYVGRSKKKRIVSLLCNYRFDEEHGLALIFENEKLKHIGTQDDAL